MRNLKRTLSLLLAAVMVIGLMVVGASAVSYNDFPDRDEIVNKDAVSMLTTLGIIEGTDQGTFDPTGDVDRAQMAKMISVTLTNNENCDTLYQTVDSGLTDIASNWARGYINYCYVRGIIAGRGDNTFDPGANVTAVEAAKMLLTALGYNAEIEGLVGPDWALNTAALAQQLGIFRNFTKDISAPLNRDDAALLIYNAMDVELIQQYSNGYALVYSDHRTILSSVFGVMRVEGVVVGNEWARLEETDSAAALREGRTNLENVVVYDSTTANTTVGEGVRYDDIVSFNVATSVDYIGKAVTLYVEKTTVLSGATVIGIATNDDMNVIHTTTATEKTLDDLLDGTNMDTDRNTQYYVNYGWCEDGASEAVELINMYANEALEANNAYYNVNGVDVEVIDNDDDGTAEYVLYVQDTLSEVSRYSERNETISFFAPELSNGEPTGDSETVTRDFDDVVFNDEVAADDLILYVEYGGRTYIQLAPIVTDTMNRVDRDRNSELYITLDNGEEYRQAYLPDAASMTDVELTHFDITKARTEPGFDDEYDFILDATEQYVIAIRPATEQVTNYALVLGSAWTQNALTKSGEIKVLMADGTEGTYTLNWSASDDAFAGVTAIKEQAWVDLNNNHTQDEGEAFADMTPEEVMQFYLGSTDVNYSSAVGYAEVNSAAGSVITYSLNSDGTRLTIESVLMGNQWVDDTTTVAIKDVNNTSTAGVSDDGWVRYIDGDGANLQYELAENYDNRDGTIVVKGNASSGRTTEKSYAVDLDTVAFYYYLDDNGKAVYGVATGWDDMSNVTAGTAMQIYPTLERTASRTYQATNLADLILFNAPISTDSNDYLLVLDANAAARGDLWYLTVVFEDGTVEEITVDDDDRGEFDPDVYTDFMQAYAYSENSDGTYSLGKQADNVGRGTVVNYRNRTVAFTSGAAYDPDTATQYISLATNANVWDVSDAEAAGDETYAASFTSTRMNTVMICDNDGQIRTAWVWDYTEPTTPTTPTVYEYRNTDAYYWIEDVAFNGISMGTPGYVYTDQAAAVENAIEVRLSSFGGGSDNATITVTTTQSGWSYIARAYTSATSAARATIGTPNTLSGATSAMTMRLQEGSVVLINFGTTETHNGWLAYEIVD